MTNEYKVEIEQLIRELNDMWIQEYNNLPRKLKENMDVNGIDKEKYKFRGEKTIKRIIEIAISFSHFIPINPFHEMKVKTEIIVIIG